MASLAALIDAYETRGTRQRGAYCKRGHERAVHERVYAYGNRVIRSCRACQQFRDRERDRSYRARRTEQPSHPDALIWERFCRTIEQRILAVRAQTPRCDGCGGAS